MDLYSVLFGALLGVIAAVLLNYFSMKLLRVSNAHLKNESDYYFMLQALFFKTMSSEQQKEIREGSEVVRIKETFRLNSERIKRTGKY